MMLDGKVVVVSGIGPGMGIEIARAAVREGADVVLAARSADFLEKSAAELASSSRRVAWLPTDITEVAQCEALAEHALREMGRVDALVNNAYRPSVGLPFEQTRAEDWRIQFEVNFVGTLQVTQAFLPALRAADEGAIAMISTIGGRRPRANQVEYAASKSAVQSATRSLALELGPDGIRVNTIAVGWMKGPPVEEGMRRLGAERGVDPQTLLDEVRRGIPLGDLPDDADCANAVIFMVSDLARAITGATLDVNGGAFMP
jgi:NAD(P)-dependent dehydrogenase (short-subunit alcohol dehydrogenase family)